MEILKLRPCYSELTKGNVTQEIFERDIKTSHFKIIHNCVDQNKYPGHRCAVIEASFLDKPGRIRKISWYYGNTDKTYFVIEGIQAEKEMNILGRIRGHENSAQPFEKKHAHVVLIPPFADNPEAPKNEERELEYRPGARHYERHQQFLEGLLTFYRQEIMGNNPQIIPIGFSLSGTTALDAAFRNEEIKKIVCVSPPVHLMDPLIPSLKDEKHQQTQDALLKILNHGKPRNAQLSSIKIHINREEIHPLTWLGEEGPSKENFSDTRRLVTDLFRSIPALDSDEVKKFGVAPEELEQICGIQRRQLQKLGIATETVAFSCLAEWVKKLRAKTGFDDGQIKTYLYGKDAERNTHDWWRWGEMIDAHLRGEK